MRTSGAKPLSTFGLIHKIPIFKPVLEDDVYSRRYPNLLSADQSDGGVVDYVKDNFVNLGPFETDKPEVEVDNEKVDPDQTRLPF